MVGKKQVLFWWVKAIGWVERRRRHGHLDVYVRGAESLPPAIEEVHHPKEYTPHCSAARWPDPVSGNVKNKVPVEHLLLAKKWQPKPCGWVRYGGVQVASTRMNSVGPTSVRVRDIR